MNFEDSLRRQVEYANAVTGSLSGLDCPLCKNRGYITEVRGSYVVSVECKCMAARRSMKRIEKSGLGDLLKRCSFENFKTDVPWQAEMKQVAQSYLAHGRGKWFAAMGAVGAGKTHICTALCSELLSRGIEVRYMLWRDESTRIKALTNDAEGYKKLVDPLKTVPVLYIDDLFKTRQGDEITKADVNLAFELLNNRYCDRKLATVISSEKTIEEITDIDEAIGSRIYERSKGFYLKLGGQKNRRLL